MPKSISTLDASVILPLESKVTIPTLVEEPTVPPVTTFFNVAIPDTFSWPLKSTFHVISPVAAILLELLNESAVATFASLKFIETSEAEVITPLLLTVNRATLVLLP